MQCTEKNELLIYPAAWLSHQSIIQSQRPDSEKSPLEDFMAITRELI